MDGPSHEAGGERRLGDVGVRQAGAGPLSLNERAAMTAITAEMLFDSCRAGGPSCLSVVTELRPAGGLHTSVAPAKFAPKQGRGSVYAFERRYDGDRLRDVVIIDSKQSQLNRAEAALALGIQDENPVLARMPRIELTYRLSGSVDRSSDLQLPHRAFDGHLRAGTIDGTPTTLHPDYIALRNASPLDAGALLRASPVTLTFGGWDASRQARQGRWRSLLVGEIIGFCADKELSERGGARVDPFAMQVLLDPDAADAIVDNQRADLSGKTAAKITAEAASARKKKERVGGSELGLGGIPPSLSQLAGVACDRIVRSHVLSFAAVRQMRFGASAEGDAACRAVLMALAINGMVRSFAELCLRANCDLIESGEPVFEIDRRGGVTETLVAPSVDEADRVLEDALVRAKALADLDWQGQVLRVEGNPDVLAGAVDDEA